MKTIVTKQQVKNAGVSTVRTIASPLHMGLQLVSNLVQLTADGVALGEGYLANKIDSSIEAEEVATCRVEHTKQQFMKTAMALEFAKYKLSEGINSANDKMSEIKDKMFSKEEPQQHIVVEGRFRVKQA